MALVTGAQQGIGRAIAVRLAGAGATVAVNDLAPTPALRDVAGQVGGLPVAADMADPAAVREMVAKVERRAGPVEWCVSNAAQMSMGPLVEADLDAWWRQVEVNLSGAFHLVQAVLPGMRRLGRGRIVLVSSEWGVIGWPNATGYAASKAGLVALAKTLGRELAPEGILVNAVAPSVVDTPQLDVDARDAGVSPAEIRERYAATVPLGRIARPEEIAATVAFLLGPGGSAFVGQVLQPNGGTTRTRA